MNTSAGSRHSGWAGAADEIEKRALRPLRRPPSAPVPQRAANEANEANDAIDRHPDRQGGQRSRDGERSIMLITRNFEARSVWAGWSCINGRFAGR